MNFRNNRKMWNWNVIDVSTPNVNDIAINKFLINLFAFNFSKLF